MSYMTYGRFAGVMAILAGLSGLLYAVAFIVLQHILLYSFFLLIGGIFSAAALIELYYLVRDTDGHFARFALVFGLAGALGATIHGGYDLGNALTPAGNTAATNLPNPVDPRGLLTFGFTAIALFVFSWLIIISDHHRSNRLPTGLGYLGYLSAILLAVIYAGRVTILDPLSPYLIAPALLSGFLINPLWYLWLGVGLLQSERNKRHHHPSEGRMTEE